MHNDFLAAPARVVPIEHAEYMTELLRSHMIKPSKLKKLIPNPQDKKKYTVHHATLKTFLEMSWG